MRCLACNSTWKANRLRALGRRGLIDNLQSHGAGQAQHLFHQVDEVPAVFLAGPDHTGQNRMRLSAARAPIAAVGFADEDGRANLALGGVVGGGHGRDVQEGQQMPALFAQEFGQAGVVGVGVVTGQQAIQCGFQATTGHGIPVVTDFLVGLALRAFLGVDV